MKEKLLLLSFFYFSLLLQAELVSPLPTPGESCHEEEEVVSRSMFPDDFIFGVSTSAYQIEGAYLEDGKTLNNWDVFTHVPGNFEVGNNGDIADDHYHRLMEDIEIIVDLGVNAYRFSISWSRILPNGRFGNLNPDGVMFYNKIIDNLLLKGIEPFVTIHHNDIPQLLEDKYGSWLSPLMQEDFVHFAKTCFEEFGDRVKYWTTINEPNILAEMAYMRGWFPPEHCSPPFGNCSTGNSDVEPLTAGHNMLLSHAKAVKLYRQQFQPKQGGSIGIVIHAFNYDPYRDDEFSQQAVERAYAFKVAWMLDPLVYGDYPPLMREYLGKELPKFSKDEAKLLKGSVDFLGINHYSSWYTIDCFHSTECTSSDNRPIQGFASVTPYRDDILIGQETGTADLYVVPHGMEKVVDYIHARYPNNTIYITENGYSPLPQAQVSDMLQDIERIRYHKAYLAALAKSMRKGAKVKGYFAWSLMDNFEWLHGFNSTFGLYHVDRRTLKRTPKHSATWFANFIANGQKSVLKSSEMADVFLSTVVST